MLDATEVRLLLERIDVTTPIGYLKTGCMLENAAAMANPASRHTAQLYDRHRADISPDEVERIHP